MSVQGSLAMYAIHALGAADDVASDEVTSDEVTSPTTEVADVPAEA